MEEPVAVVIDELVGIAFTEAELARQVGRLYSERALPIVQLRAIRFRPPCPLTGCTTVRPRLVTPIPVVEGVHGNVGTVGSREDDLDPRTEVWVLDGASRGQLDLVHAVLLCDRQPACQIGPVSRRRSRRHIRHTHQERTCERESHGLLHAVTSYLYPGFSVHDTR